MPSSEAVIARVGEPITGPKVSSSCSHTSSCNKSRAISERNGSRSSPSLSRKPPDNTVHCDAVKCRARLIAAIPGQKECTTVCRRTDRQ
ncbi:hypothetical protein D3C81_1935970 [compost metagenome]